MDRFESKRFSSLRLRILSTTAAAAAAAAAADAAGDDLLLSRSALKSLWQQSEPIECWTKLLFIKDLLFCLLLLLDFFEMLLETLAAAATAALLFEIKA